MNLVKRMSKRLNKILKEIKKPNKTRKEKRNLGKRMMQISPLLILIPFASGIISFFMGLSIYLKNKKNIL